MALDPSVYDGVQRDGLQSVVKFAKLLCGLRYTFGPILRLKYRNNPSIQSLLDTLDEVCALLPQAEASLIVGGDNSDPISDPAAIPGVDLSAPLWIEEQYPNPGA